MYRGNVFSIPLIPVAVRVDPAEAGGEDFMFRSFKCPREATQGNGSTFVGHRVGKVLTLIRAHSIGDILYHQV